MYTITRSGKRRGIRFDDFWEAIRYANWCHRAGIAVIMRRAR